MPAVSSVPLKDLTAVSPAGDGLWRATAAKQTRIPGGLVNGGVLLAIAARSLVEATGRPHPVSITGHFLAAVRPGELTVSTDVLRPGPHTFARAIVRDADDNPVLAVTAVLADLEAASGPTMQLGDLPPVADRGAAIVWPPDDADQTRAPDVFSLFRHQVLPDGFGWAFGKPGGDAVVESFAQPAIGDWDPIDLLVLADVYPPPIFNAGLPFAWVPTLELTVQLRGLPRGDELVASRFSTALVTDGYLEEDGLLRGMDGRVLALSRQLALAPRPRD